MESIKILLAGYDRRLNNMIEAAVLDVCFNHAAVHCTRSGRLEEFVRLAPHPEFDLVVLAGGNLLAGLPEPMPGPPLTQSWTRFRRLASVVQRRSWSPVHLRTMEGGSLGPAPTT
jgi:hypothetical protein